MIYVIFGEAESGKTALANNLMRELRKMYGPNASIFNIDGDELRSMMLNNDRTTAGIYENARIANAIATYLNHMGCEVIVSLVNPYEELRKELKNLNPKDVKFIYLFSDRKNNEKFEVPEKIDLTLNTSQVNIQKCLSKILDL